MKLFKTIKRAVIKEFRLIFPKENKVKRNIEDEFYIDDDKEDLRYVMRDEAIEIASKESNLRKCMYQAARKNGYNYGLIDIKDYYATLVKIEKHYAWYIKVLDAIYEIKSGEVNRRGYYEEDDNIACIVLAESGKFIFLDKNFDTRDIHMVSDDEYLTFINNRYK